MTDERVAAAYVAYLEALARRWSSSAAAALINSELLSYLQPRFHRCSTPIKVRAILSLLYLSPQVRLDGRESLLLLLGEAEVDKDEWVKKLARLASSFVLVGAIDVRETDSETAFQILKFLNEQRDKHQLVYQHKPPLEAPHLANILTEKPLTAPDWKDQDIDQVFTTFLADSGCTAVRSEFTPKIDFIAFNQELMRKGETSMRRHMSSAKAPSAGNASSE